MEFFNQKEEVLDIKLTQYGKRLLAEGEFSPKYYAFFDKDIVYNSEYAGFPEQQNDTETRIKDETSRLKVQHNFIGIETQFHEMKEIIKNEDKLSDKHIKEKLQDIENKYFALASAIGTTQLKNEYSPAWEMKFYNESLSGSSGMITGSSTPYIKIPQLETTLTFRTFMTKDLEDINIDPFEVAGDPTLLDDQIILEAEPLVFENGSGVALQQDFLLAGIDEKNTDFLNENFEIEVFMFEDVTGDESFSGKNEFQRPSKLIPLRFFPTDPEAVSMLEEQGITPDTNPNFVEYYFDIQTDQDIPESLLCGLVHEDDKKSLYVKQIFRCPEDAEKETYGNIYEDDKLGDACE